VPEPQSKGSSSIQHELLRRRRQFFPESALRLRQYIQFWRKAYQLGRPPFVDPRYSSSCDQYTPCSPSLDELQCVSLTDACLSVAIQPCHLRIPPFRCGLPVKARSVCFQSLQICERITRDIAFCCLSTRGWLLYTFPAWRRGCVAVSLALGERVCRTSHKTYRDHLPRVVARLV
jgi:hypothetical protein